MAGIIVFGSLMGAMFLGQQFMQNVLGYSTVSAGAAILPAALFMILVAPRSAKLVHARGSRFTLLLSFVVRPDRLPDSCCSCGTKAFPTGWSGIAYAFLGIGVGLGGTPSSNSLTASVPVTRVGMASGTADLQRDLGGALMQSIFGRCWRWGLPQRWAATIAASPESAQVTASVTSQLEMSYASAETIAAEYPQYATQITAAAKTSFLAGDQYAYIAGIIAVLIGAMLIFFMYPKKRAEKLLAEYQAEDQAAMAAERRLQVDRQWVCHLSIRYLWMRQVRMRKRPPPATLVTDLVRVSINLTRFCTIWEGRRLAVW